MSDPKFNNVENECVKTEDGREVWLSRSMAVSALVIAFSDGEPFALVSKRGTGTPDYQGYFNVVCGYLDNKETLYDACLREIFEESGVNIKEYKDRAAESFRNIEPQTFFGSPFYDNYGQPCIINDDIKANRGNVTIGFIFKINCSAFDPIKIGGKIKSNLPNLTNKHSEPNEVDDLEWMPFNPEEIKKKQFAFGHEKRLMQVYNKLYVGNDIMVERNRIINSLGAPIRLDMDFKWFF